MINAIRGKINMSFKPKQKKHDATESSRIRIMYDDDDDDGGGDSGCAG